MSKKKQNDSRNISSERLNEESFEYVNRVRDSLGMPQIDYVLRKCLRCSKEFKAKTKIGNFMCDRCKHYRSDTSLD